MIAVKYVRYVGASTVLYRDENGNLVVDPPKKYPLWRRQQNQMKRFMRLAKKKNNDRSNRRHPRR